MGLSHSLETTAALSSNSGKLRIRMITKIKILLLLIASVWQQKSHLRDSSSFFSSQENVLCESVSYRSCTQTYKVNVLSVMLMEMCVCR